MQIESEPVLKYLAGFNLWVNPFLLGQPVGSVSKLRRAPRVPVNKLSTHMLGCLSSGMCSMCEPRRHVNCDLMTDSNSEIIQIAANYADIVLLVALFHVSACGCVSEGS